MAKAKKKQKTSKAKNPKYRTPRGVLKYPHLNKPDDRFEDPGVYQASLILDAAEASELIAAIDSRVDDLVAELKEEGKKVKREKLRVPYEYLDDDESKIELKVKQSSEYDGEKKVLLFFDAKGNRIPFKKVPSIWGGSEVKISGTIRKYISGANKGITLSISAVQLLKLSEGSEADAEDFGFGEEEDGYSFEEQGFEDADDEDFDGDEDDEEDEDEEF